MELRYMKYLKTLYVKYIKMWYIDHTEGEPASFKEFCDNEAQDSDIVAEIERRWKEYA